MKKSRSSGILYITYAAIIAAMYTVLTLIAASMGLSSGAVQVRLSEALTVLPLLTPAAIPGLTIGCFISNLITGCLIEDVIFGTLATLIGAVGTRYLGRIHPVLAPVPPILSNTIIVPWVLKYVYSIENGIPYLMATVGAGEIISCGVLGLILLYAIKDRRIFKEL